MIDTINVSVNFQGTSKMPRYMRRSRHDAGRQNAVEHAVSTSEVVITKTANEVGAGEAERACAVNDKSPNRVRVLAIASLNQMSSCRVDNGLGPRRGSDAKSSHPQP